jgi:hypothetical protein
MNHPDLVPRPFVLPELVSDKAAYVKDFVKAKIDLDMRTNLAALIDITHDNYDLSQRVFAAFKTAELLTKQEVLFDLLITEAVKHGIYEAVYQVNNPRSDHLSTSHPSSRRNNYDKLARSSFPKMTLSSTPTPTASAIHKGKAKAKATCIILTPLSHRESSAPSSSRMPPSSTPNSQVWIDLTSPEPEPSTSTSLRRLPTPPLIYPDHMRDSTCHSCGRTGLFASFCPQYKCVICKKTAPKHYQNACPSRNSRTPPPRYRHDYEEEHLNTEDYDFDFDDDAIANMTGEPSGPY